MGWDGRDGIMLGGRARYPCVSRVRIMLGAESGVLGVLGHAPSWLLSLLNSRAGISCPGNFGLIVRTQQQGEP